MHILLSALSPTQDCHFHPGLAGGSSGLLQNWPAPQTYVPACMIQGETTKQGRSFSAD